MCAYTYEEDLDLREDPRRAVPDTAQSRNYKPHLVPRRLIRLGVIVDAVLDSGVLG